MDDIAALKSNVAYNTVIWYSVASCYPQVALEMWAPGNRKKKVPTGYLTLIKILYDRITENRVVY